MTEYNIEIREYNGIDYDILYPKTKMNNVDGLQTFINQINSNIQTVNNKANTNASNISNLQTSINEIEGDINSITSDITNIDGDISSLNDDMDNIRTVIATKQDKNELGSLAFKNKALLNGNSEVDSDIEGILPIANGGTGSSSPSGALNKLGITISNVSINVGDDLTSGAIYICYT